MKKILLMAIVTPLLFAKSISFQDALDLTLANNKELKAKQYDIALAKESAKEPGAHKLGKFEFKETISRSNNALHVFGMKLSSREATFGAFGFADFDMSNPDILNVEPKDLNYPKARNNFETKVVYEVPLFTGYKLENAQTMADLQVLANKAKFSHDKKQIGIEVIKAYNGAVAAKKFIQMTESAMKITKRFENTAQDLFNSGLTRGLDVSQAKMANSSLAIKRNEAMTQFRLAIAYLRFLTSDHTIDDVDGFKSFKLYGGLRSLQKRALTNRDDLKWMKHNVKTMKTKVDYESGDDYPMVGLHAEYGTNDNTLTLSGDKDYYTVGVGITYNLFDGGASSIAKQKAKIEYAKTKEYENLMTDGIELEVEKNYLEYRSLTKNLKEKIKTQKMAEDILAETEEVYKNNLKYRTNMTYLLMSLQNMLVAQADVITSKYKQTEASAQLQLAIGSSLRK
jgi:outer membrane protein